MTALERIQLSSVTIGQDTTTQEMVSIDAKGRQHSTYIIGMRQYGKSNLLEHIACTDMANGDGLCFIDPLGKSADKLIQLIPEHRRKDVIFWDIADQEKPFGFNPFFCPNEREVSKRAGEFLDFLHNLQEFREVFKNSPRVDEILFHVAVTFLVNPGATLTEAHHFLNQKEYRKAFYAKLMPTFFWTHQFWKDVDENPTFIPATSYNAALNKLSRFIESDVMGYIFGQPTNSIDWRSAMDDGKIIIVRLTDEIGPKDSSFIGAYIVWDIRRSMYKRQNPRPFHFIVDEFSRYMTTTFSRIHDEGGNFGVDVIIAHQHRDQIDDTNIKGSTLAVGNKIFFRVSGRDGAELGKEFDYAPRDQLALRQQPIVAIPFDPIRHLANGGHPNPVIESLFSRAKFTLIRYLNTLENNVSQGFNGETRIGHTNKESYTQGLYEFVRSYLYKRMKDEDDFATLYRAISSLQDADGIRNTVPGRITNMDALEECIKVTRLECQRLRTEYETVKNEIYLYGEYASEIELQKYDPGKYQYDIDNRKKRVFYINERIEHLKQELAVKGPRLLSELAEDHRSECSEKVQIQKEKLDEYYWKRDKIIRKISELRRLLEVSEAEIWKNMFDSVLGPNSPRQTEERKKKEEIERLEMSLVQLNQSHHPTFYDLELYAKDVARESEEQKRRSYIRWGEKYTDEIKQLEKEMADNNWRISSDERSIAEIAPKYALLKQKRDIGESYKSQSSKLWEDCKSANALLDYLEMIYRDLSTIVQLGDALEKEPIKAQMSQYETVYDRPQSPHDVEATTSTKLSQLPKYTAHCNLVPLKEPGNNESRPPVEHMIRTLPPLEPTAESIERGEQIREHSRTTYGRDRNQVEEEIRKRLEKGGNNTGQSPSKDVPPAPDGPPSPPYSHYDDPPISTDE